MTKDRILQVATQEFSKYGFDAVSMNKLAVKLDVNKATIYYYFKDKQNLYQSVMTNLISMNKDENEAILKSDLNPKEKFKKYIALFVKRMINNPGIIPLSLREMANLGANVDHSIAIEIEYEILYLKKIVQDLPLKDKYKDLDFYELKSVIMGTINSYYSFQMSHIDMIGLKDFNKQPQKVFDYLEHFVANLLLDALCQE
ncbi:MAG: TetR/AcrR family transcriptional regulator [Campylobacterales bacterium]|nr:TetR/AcrR family transcriptional regulator [Campylobacterales bacterium]